MTDACMPILVCTNNQGKAEEISKILGGIDTVTLKDRGIELDVDEDQQTLEGNALKKARAGMEASGLPTIGDDTGLFIDALDGEPGLKVRRWPGYEAEDEELIDLCLEKLEGVPLEKRTARFTTAMVYVDPDGNKIAVEGHLNGRITEARTAEYKPGLPFDTIFWAEDVGATLAERYDKKSELSHRVRAGKKLAQKLKDQSLI
ncbi:MAG: non-canonical purine NTP pyrophosphatase [bacterium]